ncbi:MAG TPA: helix-turn-helix transcriptional regulator [Bryobacteraceae bacterium]
MQYGTIYPALLRLEQEGHISSEWGVFDINRRAKYYSLTRSCRRRVTRATRDWRQTTAILERFRSPQEGES